MFEIEHTVASARPFKIHRPIASIDRWPRGAMRTRIVIKLGGAAMTAAVGSSELARDIAWLVEEGAEIVIVHGGGEKITSLASSLGVATRFVDGQRYTSDETVELVLMTLAGGINKELVGTLRRGGVDAFGLSGIDGGLLCAERMTPNGVDLGNVGKVVSVDHGLITMLHARGMVPVVAPVAADAAGTTLNVNADLAAAALATALDATALVYLSDVGGVLGPDGLVDTLDRDGALALIERGVICGGMVPKVRSALATIAAGVGAVAIVDGRVQGALRGYFMGRAVGTRIVRRRSTSGIAERPQMRAAM